MQVNIYANHPRDGIEPEEQKLYDLVNQYRGQNGLPPIPLSPSLSLVANRHVVDLAENIGTLTHGWSDAPYDASNSDTWPSMWNAPQRFNTGYPGRGYENAFGGSAGFVATADNALQAWQTSPGHNSVILNQGTWQNFSWDALGVGIYEEYAVLWFGDEPDPRNFSDPAPIPDPIPDPVPTPEPTLIFGTPENDVFTGGAGDDVYLGFAGFDTISGGAGNDDLYGNLGNDNISGEDGNDIVRGGKGEDVIYGNDGDDIHLNGNIGNDWLLGGDGRDAIYGGKDNDRLEGEAGDDYLSGDLGVDTLVGGSGVDTYALRGDTYDVVYYNDLEDLIGLPDGLTYEDISLGEGFDEVVPDNQSESYIWNRSTGELLAVLPNVSAFDLDEGDFVSI